MNNPSTGSAACWLWLAPGPLRTHLLSSLPTLYVAFHHQFYYAGKRFIASSSRKQCFVLSAWSKILAPPPRLIRSWQTCPADPSRHIHPNPHVDQCLLVYLISLLFLGLPSRGRLHTYREFGSIADQTDHCLSDNPPFFPFTNFNTIASSESGLIRTALTTVFRSAHTSRLPKPPNLLCLPSSRRTPSSMRIASWAS